MSVVLFCFLLFCFVISVDGPEPWYFGSKSSPESKQHGRVQSTPDAKRVSGRFKTMCQSEASEKFWHREGPRWKREKKGCENKLFFPNSLKTGDNTGFDIEMRWK